MKPLIRWTIGPVHRLGFEALEYSTKYLKKIYGDQFDYLICHNQQSPNRLECIKKLGIPLYEQTCEIPGMWPIDGKFHTGWKLYPPRLRQDAHEIVIDNDVIIFKRLKVIDRFLESNKVLFTSGRFRNLGPYEEDVPKGMMFNSGIIGFPPGFDFTSMVLEKMSHGNGWSDNYFEEQGIIASILTNQDFIEIPNQTVMTMHHINDMSGTNPWKAKGFHFVESNRGNNHCWEDLVMSDFYIRR